MVQQFVSPAPRYQVPVPTFGGAVQRLLPGGATGYTTVDKYYSGGRGGGERVPPDIRNVVEARSRMLEQGPQGNGCLPAVRCKAKRWNKSGYYVQAVKGQPEQGGIWIAEETQLVAVRRRNLSNGPANRKALSRAKGMATQSKGLKKAARELYYATK